MSYIPLHPKLSLVMMAPKGYTKRQHVPQQMHKKQAEAQAAGGSSSILICCAVAGALCMLLLRFGLRGASRHGRVKIKDWPIHGPFPPVLEPFSPNLAAFTHYLAVPTRLSRFHLLWAMWHMFTIRLSRFHLLWAMWHTFEGMSTEIESWWCSSSRNRHLRAGRTIFQPSTSFVSCLSLLFWKCLSLRSPSNKHQVLDMCFLLVLTGLMLMERKIRRERNRGIMIFTNGEMVLSCRVGEADGEVMTCWARWATMSLS